MPKIRVLIADDSALARALLRSYLESDASIEIVGEADNGQTAVALAMRLRPQVITMDLEMPMMNGMEAIGEIMRSSAAAPILVVSDYVDAQRAYDALLAGAVEVINKPDYGADQTQNFIYKVKLLAGVCVARHRQMASSITTVMLATPSPFHCQTPFSTVFAIASSTGGPQALVEVLGKLPSNFASPVLIAQHISAGFAQGMVDWLCKLCALPVVLARQGDTLASGKIYISPPEFNLSVTQQQTLQLSPADNAEIYHPRCDVLLASVAQVFRERAVGIILTGMGSDGTLGMTAIHEQGGKTWAQDEASSLIYGMNQVAIASGKIQTVMPLHHIAPSMIALAGAQ